MESYGTGQKNTLRHDKGNEYKKPISNPNHIEWMTPAMVAPNTPGINGGAKGPGLSELTGLPTLVDTMFTLLRQIYTS